MSHESPELKQPGQVGLREPRVQIRDSCMQVPLMTTGRGSDDQGNLPQDYRRFSGTHDICCRLIGKSQRKIVEEASPLRSVWWGSAIIEMEK